MFLSMIGNDSVPEVDDYNGLLLEGSTITFSCPPGFELIGLDSATCAENGNWEPDPSGLFCNDSGSNNIIIGNYNIISFSFRATRSCRHLLSMTAIRITPCQ